MLLHILIAASFIIAGTLSVPAVNQVDANSGKLEQCPPYFMGNETSPCWDLNGTCYCFTSIKARNWGIADRACREGNMTLINLESQEEDAMIRQHILTNFNPIPGNNGTEYWTSGRYSPTNERWEWTGSEQEMIFTNWLPGQPDFNDGDSCALLYYLTDSRGLWADNTCTHGVPYICEAPISIKNIHLK